MASTGNIQTTPSSSDPSSCFEHRWKYQVFLSFGCKTRYKFSSHLYNALREKVIHTFKDDERLEIGTPIREEVLNAIEKSEMAVIIISKDYASSTWCLEELVKIVECRKYRNMKVLPIFYHVEPSDVRRQLGTFGDAFARHEQNPENKETVQTWRNALKEVANLSGYLVDRGDEPTVIKIIVETISRIMMNLVDDHEDNHVSDMASISNIQTTPSSDPSSCSKHRWKYEVFLSFGCETCNTFMSYLCNELRKKFIYTLKDDDSVEIGRPIKKELLDAIEKSRMAVIIISKEYASSTWCLEELVKIVECMDNREMKVLPIFYHVDPSDVQKQEDTFRDAFAEHEKNPGNKDKVQTWRNALKEVANLSGYHLKSG
ncbi:hypothetical protein I3760_16G013400 [Carya illinoinensis]|nr:hypothetical protein I3760_16G013400 [Carya illinoinensis]